MKFFIREIFRKFDQITQFPAYLAIFTEEILNEKLHFLCNVFYHLADPTDFPLFFDTATKILIISFMLHSNCKAPQCARYFFFLRLKRHYNRAKSLAFLQVC